MVYIYLPAIYYHLNLDVTKGSLLATGLTAVPVVFLVVQLLLYNYSLSIGLLFFYRVMELLGRELQLPFYLKLPSNPQFSFETCWNLRRNRSLFNSCNRKEISGTTMHICVSTWHEATIFRKGIVLNFLEMKKKILLHTAATLHACEF